MLNRKRTALVFQLNLALTFVEGLLVLWSFVKEPSEPGSSVFFGFSYLRLILILGVFSLLLAILVLLFGSFMNSRRAQASEKFLAALAHQKGIFWILTLWMVLLYTLLFSSEQYLGFLASYRERLFPILLWFAVLSIQFSLVILYLRGMNPEILHNHRDILISASLLLLSFAFLVLIVKLTRVGLTPDRVYWQGPGAPLLLQQVLLAAFAGVLFYLFLEVTRFGRSTRLDLIVFLSLWGIACLIWLTQPAKLTWFSLEPTAPNYQSYPFSDALVYDHTAREFLIGRPIPTDFWSKPLYSLFLAVLHLFSGGNYTFLVSLQVIILAIIPAVAYLLTARLGSRPAGVVLALLLTLREHNALALSNVIQVSHVKLLLSDVFAMGFMVLLFWLFFHWLEKPGERRVTPLVFGGVLSLLVLTRGHPILLLPFMLCAVLLVPFPRSSLRWEAIVLTFLGFLIPLLPWFWRNYELTGKLAFQYPVSPYSAQMSTVYSFAPSVLDPQNSPPRYPGESDFVYYDRLQKQAFTFVVQHPDQVAKFISAHYFHNSIFSYIYLPYSFQIENIKEYVNKEPFWGNWTGELSFQGWILLLINIGMIALGFGYLWKKHKHLAFVPLFFGMGYNFSVSVGRLSGWRFILPADWITLIYYSIGLMEFYYVLRSLANQEADPDRQEVETRHSVQALRRSSFIGFALFFLAIGLVLTTGQGLFSQRYPEKTVLQLKEDYSRITSPLPAFVSGSRLDDFLKTQGAVIAYGQALNPSFFTADKDRENGAWSVYYFWPSYKPKPFSRIVFNLNGPKSAGVILPLASPPARFPDGSDVIVIGCLAESGEINALSVLVLGAAPISYTSEPFPAPACPFSEPY
ncbi:MAG TPA: hypothetical protein VK249_13470 [Anaerolineales bacterium]|nr:hypothetical protein [Anaerolineales bacterium]